MHKTSYKSRRKAFQPVLQVVGRNEESFGWNLSETDAPINLSPGTGYMLSAFKPTQTPSEHGRGQLVPLFISFGTMLFKVTYKDMWISSRSSDLFSCAAFD